MGEEEREEAAAGGGRGVPDEAVSPPNVGIASLAKERLARNDTFFL
jgi:hypothetical protein